MRQLSLAFARPLPKPKRKRSRYPEWEQLELFAPPARRATICLHCNRSGFWKQPGLCPAARQQAFFAGENHED